MTIIIEESEIKQGHFEQKDIFQIEDSKAVILLGDGIKKVECIFMRDMGKDKSVVFVEVKNSIPRAREEFFGNIKMKMLHSLMLWVAALLGRQPSILKELPKHLKTTGSVKLPIKSLLVIPNIPTDHLAGASDMFRRALSIERKIWNIGYSDVVVLNKEKVAKLVFLAI